MAGHSRWSQIKRKKGVNDAKRGKIFTKLIREITVAARAGGGDPDMNARLRSAVFAAKGQNMPSDNIDRAIKKGTGELEGAAYVEYMYEGYGPGGCAMIVDTLTDNKQRTASEVRHIFSRFQGNLGEPGSVAWNFDTRGLILIAKEYTHEEQLMNIVLEQGAQDIKDTDTHYEIFTDPKDLEPLKTALDKASIQVEVAEIAKIPKTLVKVEGKEAQTTLKLIEALEDNDDVQSVYTNSDMPQDIIDAFSHDK